MQALSALAERQCAQVGTVGTVEPNQIESHIDGRSRAPEKITEPWPARFVGGNDLTVENRVAHIE
jgi:hypothetical protein